MAYLSVIDQETGEIDALKVLEFAHLRAAREWGGPAPSPAYIRQALAWYADRAHAERLQWRQHRGLPDESPCTMSLTLPWGASGDSFGRR